MNKLVIVRIGKEITGVFISPKATNEDGALEVDVVDFSKPLTPWEEKTMELIEESKLQKVA